MLTLKRFAIIIVAFTTTTFLTALGVVEADTGLIGGPTVAIFGILALLLVFGVQVDRIEIGPLVIDFSEQAGQDNPESED
jgi:hypothetical protein